MHHALGEISANDAAVCPKAVGHQETSFAGSCSKFEDRVARPGIDEIDQTVRDRPRRAEDPGAVPIPCGSDSLPSLSGLPGEFVGLA